MHNIHMVFLILLRVLWVWLVGWGGVQAEASGLPVLEITCNKLAVPFEMSLESVRAYLWKRSDDLVLEYAQRGATPARLPKLAPPS
jgi:hypothetical protein